MTMKQRFYNPHPDQYAITDKIPHGTRVMSVIRLASENAKLRDALKLIMNNPEQGGHWCADQAAWALRLYAEGCAEINPNAKLRAKADKYDQLIKDIGAEMRDPNGTIWDEAKRLKDENKRLELEKVILRHALIQIHDGHDGHRPIDPVGTAWIALNATTAPK